mmetsp:Transcript_7349/g.11402  ORF Transcript_7349/g.11402 Transcript_7349/m.11402 type:complete len:88 (-) Transcript_7349:27-290(-)
MIIGFSRPWLCYTCHVNNEQKSRPAMQIGPDMSVTTDHLVEFASHLMQIPSPCPLSLPSTPNWYLEPSHSFLFNLFDSREVKAAIED